MSAVMPCSDHPLSALQARIRALAERFDAATLASTYHPRLCPLLWHVGHVAFVETYWLWEHCLGDDRHTRDWHRLYRPEFLDRKTRRRRLPASAAVLGWSERRHAENRTLLAEPPPRLRRHPLMRHDYLHHFLIQHHAQHWENMQLVRIQRALARAPVHVPDDALPAAAPPPRPNTVALPVGRYRIGTDNAATAFDNERPVHSVALDACRIARQPVTQYGFLQFMLAGGYRQRACWSEAGWHWLQQASVTHPEPWRRDQAGRWWLVDETGLQPLQGGETLWGINWYEAEAYARWAGARLPHEYEWEAAARLGLLEDVGIVWEWCANAFHPYPGFRTYPYKGYSEPWFEPGYRVLRGGSRHTLSVIRRPGFRNFYPLRERHILAGLRLVYDTHPHDRRRNSR